MLERMVASDFLAATTASMLMIDTDPAALLDRLAAAR
jgi:hypothetical protein